MNLFTHSNRIVSSVGAFILLTAVFSLHAQTTKTEADADGKAEYAYILTVDKFNKLEEVRAAIGEWAASNEQASDRMERDFLVAGTLTERTRIMNLKYPEFAAIIRKHGLSTPEYLLASQVEVHALLLLDAETKGETKDYAKNVNPANLAFVKRHIEEIRIRFKM